MSDWRNTKVGEVFEIQLGKMLSQVSKSGKGTAPYLANRNVQWGKVNLTDLETMDFSPAEREKFSLKEGDLLVCEGGEIGRTAMWTGEITDCFYQKAIHRLRPKTREVVPLFFLYYMQWAVNCGRLNNYVSQTSIAHLTREKFWVVPISLPPLPTQRRIAAVLRTVDEVIESTEARIEKQQAIKQGLLHDLFTRGVTPDGQLRPPPSERPDLYRESKLGVIPREWEVSNLKKISTKVTDGDHHTPRRSDSGIHLLSARNVLNGSLALDDVDFVDEREYLRMIKRCHPEPGDVLISCSGTIGRVATVPDGFRCCLVRSAALVKLDSTRTDSIYIEQSLIYDGAQHQIRAGQRQAAQPNLFQSEIERLSIPIPHLDEQRRIAAIVNGHRLRLSKDESKLSKLRHLKSALMQDLLTGSVSADSIELDALMA